eukprot:5198742-Prymnesium_polylepis.2
MLVVLVGGVVVGGRGGGRRRRRRLLLRGHCIDPRQWQHLAGGRGAGVACPRCRGAWAAAASRPGITLHDPQCARVAAVDRFVRGHEGLLPCVAAPRAASARIEIRVAGCGAERGRPTCAMWTDGC